MMAHEIMRVYMDPPVSVQKWGDLLANLQRIYDAVPGGVAGIAEEDQLTNLLNALVKCPELELVCGTLMSDPNATMNQACQMIQQRIQSVEQRGSILKTLGNGKKQKGENSPDGESSFFTKDGKRKGLGQRGEFRGTCYCCGQKGHLASKCSQRGKTCSYCNVKGHVVGGCRKKAKDSKRDQVPEPVNQVSEARSGTAESSNSLANPGANSGVPKRTPLVASRRLNIGAEPNGMVSSVDPGVYSTSDIVLDDTIHILDSGTRSHIFSYVEAPVDVESVKRTICGYTGQVEEISQKCTVTMVPDEIGVNGRFTLTNVLLSKRGEVNLISVSLLCSEQNARCEFHDGTVCVRRNDDDSVVCTGRREGGIYILNVSQINKVYTVLDIPRFKDLRVEPNELVKLHYQLGHIGYAELRRLIKQNMLHGIHEDVAKFDVPVCIICAVTKIRRLPYNHVRDYGVTSPGHFFVMDMKGPFEVSSIGGNRYWSLVVDVHSRRYFIYFHKRRNSATCVDIIRKLIGDVYSEIETKPTWIHVDSASEYVSEEFITEVQLLGVYITVAEPGGHESVGMVERAHQTVARMTKCFLKHVTGNLADVKELWALAAKHSVEVLNNLPAKICKEMTRNARYFGLSNGEQGVIRPMVDFGCPTVMHNNNRSEVRGLADAGKIMMLVGYDSKRRCYRLLDTSTNRLHYSRTIVPLPDAEWTYAGSASNEGVQETALASRSDVGDNAFEPLLNAVDDNGADGQGGGHTATHGTVSVMADEPLFDDHLAESEDDKSISTLLQSLQNYGAHEDLWGDDRPPTPPLALPCRQGIELVPAQQDANIEGSNSNSTPDSVTTSGRSVRPPPRFEEYVMFIPDIENVRDAGEQFFSPTTLASEVYEPKTMTDALRDPDYCSLWKQAIMKEVETLNAHEVIDWYVELPPGAIPIKTKWVFKVKCKQDGTIEKFKARLVACGYSQVYGLDYLDTYAPVASMNAIRIVTAIAALLGRKLYHVDIKGAYHYGEIEDGIVLFIQQPEGFVKRDRRKFGCRLLRPLYGTKQGGNRWAEKLRDVLRTLGYTVSKVESSILYRLEDDGSVTIIVICTDDLLVNALERGYELLINAIKGYFEITEFGEVTYFMGIQFFCSSNGIRLCQEQYIGTLLKRFECEDMRTATTPLDQHSKAILEAEMNDNQVIDDKPFRELIGGLLYIAICTRPDVLFSVNFLSRYTSRYGTDHWKAGIRILRYLKGTAKMSIRYQAMTKNDERLFIEYVDSSHANEVDTRRSSAGHIAMFGGGPVMFRGTKAKCVSLSSCEAEFVAMTPASQDLIWIDMLMEELGMSDLISENRAADGCALLLTDNRAAIFLAKNPSSQSKRTKHIDVRFRFVCDAVERGILRVDWVASSDNLADILTKPLGRVLLQKLRDIILHSG
tara:strand:+ start:131 stop:4354 length:4224 start_codon:yes stop_codon:yes gene_type:complete